MKKERKTSRRITALLLCCLLSISTFFPAVASGETAVPKEEKQLAKQTTAAAESNVAQTQGLSDSLMDAAKNIISNTIEKTLNCIYEETDNEFVGGLSELIFGNNDYARLSKQIKETQNMIRDLSGTLTEYQSQTMNKLNDIKQEILRQNLQAVLAPLNQHASELKTLSDQYEELITSCFDANGNVKPDVDQAERERLVEDFIKNIDVKELDATLKALKAAIQPELGDALYAVQLASLKGDTAFRHDIYVPMCTMFNYITTMRSNALTFLKERTIYDQIQEAKAAGTYNDDFQPDLRYYEKQYLNPTMDYINKEAQLEPFPELAQKLGDGSWSSLSGDGNFSAEKYDLTPLEKAIDQSIQEDNVKVCGPNGKLETVNTYKIVSNNNGRTYVIVKNTPQSNATGEPPTLSDYITYSVDPPLSPLIHKNYYADYGPGITNDGKYMMPADAGAIQGLFNNVQKRDVISYLREELKMYDEKGNVQPGISEKTRVIPVAKTTRQVTGNARWDDLYCLDGLSFDTTVADTAATNQYMKISNKLITSKQVYDHAKYAFGGNQSLEIGKQPILRIYMEQNIKHSMNKNSQGIYQPSNTSALPYSFSLSDGDVLDLSQCPDDVELNHSIMVTAGNVKIMGGNRNHKNLKISLLNGANLTTSNLNVTNDGAPVVTVYGGSDSNSGNGTISIEGNNYFKTTGETAAILASDPRQYLNLVGVGALDTHLLKLASDSTNHAPLEMLGESGRLTMQNASLSLESYHPESSLICTKSEANIDSSSIVSSMKGKTTSGAKELRFGGVSGIIKNTRLDLTYGGIQSFVSSQFQNQITMKDNTWIGNMWCRLDLEIGDIYYGDGSLSEKNDHCYLVGENGQTEDLNLAKYWKGGKLKNPSTSTIELPAKGDIGKIKGIKFVRNDGDEIYLETVKLTLSRDGNVAHYPAASSITFRPHQWIGKPDKDPWHDENMDGDNNFATLYAEASDRYTRFSVYVTDAKNAGSNCGLFVELDYINDKGQQVTSRPIHLTERTKNQKFEQGKAYGINVPMREAEKIVKMVGYKLHLKTYRSGYKFDDLKIDRIGITQYNNGSGREDFTDLTSGYVNLNKEDCVVYLGKSGQSTKAAAKTAADSVVDSALEDYSHITDPTTLNITIQSAAELSKETLQKLIDSGRRIVLTSLDENGEVQYEWVLDGTLMKNLPETLKSGIKVTKVDGKKYYGIPMPKPALSVQFAQDGVVPEGTEIKLAKRQHRLSAGTQLKAYYNNTVKKALEPINQKPRVEAGENITLKAVQGKEFILTTTAVAPDIPKAKAVSTGASSIKVSWNKVSGADQYQVYRATSAKGTYTKQKTTTASNWTNTDLSTGKTYYYKVRAYSKKMGYGGFSKVVSDQPKTTPPSIKASSSNGKVYLKWTTSSNADGYVIYRAKSSDGKFGKIKACNKAARSYTDAGLSKKNTYYYKIKSYKVVKGKNIYSHASKTASAKAK